MSSVVGSCVGGEVGIGVGPKKYNEKQKVLFVFVCKTFHVILNKKKHYKKKTKSKNIHTSNLTKRGCNWIFYACYACLFHGCCFFCVCIFTKKIQAAIEKKSQKRFVYLFGRKCIMQDCERVFVFCVCVTFFFLNRNIAKNIVS